MNLPSPQHLTSPPSRSRHVYTISQLLSLRPLNPRPTSYPHLQPPHPPLSPSPPLNSHSGPTPPISIPAFPPQHPRHRRQYNADKLHHPKSARPVHPSFPRPKAVATQPQTPNGFHAAQHALSSSPPTRSTSKSYSIPHHSPPHYSTSSTFLAASPPDRSYSKSSPPINRMHYIPRLSAKADPTTNLHSLPDERQYSAALPKDDCRKRSPSPMASPTSSSPPPGFETVFLQRAATKGAARPQSAKERDAMYRSRICKGPDVANNFARRIAYHEMTCASGKTPTSLEERIGEISPSTCEGVEGEICSIEDMEDGELEAAGQKQWGKSEVGDMDRGTASAFVSYNTSNVLSFEDLSRRLVAEVANNQKMENKPCVDMDDSVEDQDMNGVHDGFVPHLLSVDTADDGEDEEEDGAQGQTCLVPGQDAVSELSKWFGRMAASTREELPCEEASFMPLDEVEREMTKSGATELQESSEELDSALVPFFNIIRNQAMNEQTDVTLENGATHGPSYGDGPSSAVDNRFNSRHNAGGNTNRVVCGEETDRLATSEVEQFFQLFSDGRPVGKGTETASGKHKISTSVHGQAEQDLMSSKTLSTETKRGSDYGELERWFRALASQKPL